MSNNGDLELRIIEWRKEIKSELAERFITSLLTMLMVGAVIGGAALFFLGKHQAVELLPEAALLLFLLAIPPMVYRLPEKPSEQSMEMDRVLNAIGYAAKSRESQ